MNNFEANNLLSENTHKTFHIVLTVMLTILILFSMNCRINKNNSIYTVDINQYKQFNQYTTERISLSYERVLPDIPIIQISDHCQYLYLYDESNSLEFPVFFIRLCISFHSKTDYNNEVIRLRSIPHKYFESTFNGILTYSDDILSAIQHKLDFDSILDGAMWDYCFVILNQSMANIDYYIIFDYDARSPIDSEVLKALSYAFDTISLQKEQISYRYRSP